MLPFDEAKLIPNVDCMDLENGTYEVKYKVDSDSPVYIWVYFEDIGENYVEIRGSPFKAGFKNEFSSKNGTMEGEAL
jgi:hypothetical protein